MASTQTKFFDASRLNGRVQISLDMDGTEDETISVSGLGDAYEISLLTLSVAPASDLKGIITDGSSTADIVQKATSTTYHISMTAGADFGTNVSITDSNSVAATTHASTTQADTHRSRVQIERIRWCQQPAGIINLKWDGAVDELIMNLYGNGHWYNDLAIKEQSLSVTDTGDILVTATTAATLILDLRKIQAYNRPSDQKN